MAAVTLTEKIEACKGKQVPSEIKELILDHSKSSSLVGLTDEFSQVETVSLVGVGLESLSGLPSLRALKKLDLSENCISGGLEALAACPKLLRLDLSANNIEKPADLEPLADLPALRYLVLSGCSVTNVEDYRNLVFSMLPRLKYLDGLDKDGNEASGDMVNGAVDEANGTRQVDEEGDAESDDSEEEDEEYGIEALQRSGDLEDDEDEEDYAPGDEEDAELDESEEDEGDEDEDAEVDDGADLSGAGVTGPRRPTNKRHHVDADDDEPSSKLKAVDSGVDEHAENGATEQKE